MRPMRTIDATPAERVVAWMGGALFVAALGYFAVFYFSAIDRAPSALGRRSPSKALAVDLTLFTVFALHHSVLARLRIKRWVAEVVSDRMERAAYVWLSSLLFFVVCLCWQAIPGILYDRHGFAAWPHLALQAGGVIMTIRAAAAIDVLELAGVRRVEGRSHHPVELSTSGPYGIVRHPIYLGWVLVVCAAPDMTFTRLAFALASTSYLIIAIRWEEASLSRQLGDVYRRYAARVRWRLLPGVW